MTLWGDENFVVEYRMAGVVLRLIGEKSQLRTRNQKATRLAPTGFLRVRYWERARVGNRQAPIVVTP
jgi:hypothetical protein